jgi:hypothetical protein
MSYVGYATISKTPSDKTRYFFGELSEIAGKEIPVLEKNQWGDCLCLVDGKGLVDVDSTDVAAYRVLEQNHFAEEIVNFIMSGAFNRRG